MAAERRVRIMDAGYEAAPEVRGGGGGEEFSLAAQVHRDVQGTLRRLGVKPFLFTVDHLVAARTAGFWRGLGLGIVSSVAGAVGAVAGESYLRPFVDLVVATWRARWGG